MDLIYEAAVIPELWPSTLDALAERAGCVGGILYTADLRQVFKWTSSEATRPLMAGYIAGGWAEKNERLSRTLALRHPGCVTDYDLFSREELEREPSYVEFLRPHGFGWVTGTAILMPSGDYAVYTFERLLKKGPVGTDEVSALNQTRPHLARAALLATRLQLEQAGAVADAMAAVGLPAAVLAGGGRLLATNGLLERMQKQIAFRAHNQLVFVEPAAQSLFVLALEDLGRTNVKSIPLRAVDDDPPCVAHLLPVKGAAHDIFSRAEAVLVVTPLISSKTVSTDLLSGLFDLTPAEARLAGGLVEGRTLSEIAGERAVSMETLKSQLRRVFAKTGTRRQSELVGLLAAANLPSRPPGG
ncbi:MAG: LuxR family transcriptional regulator [Hyphomicrobiales bacterium]|nr:LuxR family transcriptional regulator [Hyphomicrobiales bacterium]